MAQISLFLKTGKISINSDLGKKREIPGGKNNINKDKQIVIRTVSFESHNTEVQTINISNTSQESATVSGAENTKINVTQVPPLKSSQLGCMC